MREKIQYFLLEGNYDELIASSYGATDPFVMHARAIAFLEKKDYMNLIDEATKALNYSEDSNRAIFHAFRGIGFFSMGLYKNALEDYSHALSAPNPLGVGKTISRLENLLENKGMINSNQQHRPQYFRSHSNIPIRMFQHTVPPVQIFQPVNMQINHFYINQNPHLNQNNPPKVSKKRKVEQTNQLSKESKIRKKNSYDSGFFEQSKKSNNTPKLGQNQEEPIGIEDDEIITPSQVVQKRNQIWFQPPLERLRSFFNQEYDGKINEISQDEYKKFLKTHNNSEYGNYISTIGCEKSKVHIQAINAFKKYKYSKAIEFYDKALKNASPVEKIFICYDLGSLYSKNKEYEAAIWNLYEGFCVIKQLEKEDLNEQEKTAYREEAMIFLIEIQKNIQSLSFKRRVKIDKQDFLEENLKSDFEYYKGNKYKFYNNPTLEQYESATEMFSDDPERFPQELSSPQFFNKQFNGRVVIEQKDYRDPSKLDDTICARVMYELFDQEKLKLYLEKMTENQNINQSNSGLNCNK